MFGFEKNGLPRRDTAAKEMMKLFADKLEKENNYYNIHDETNMITLGFHGENFESLSFAVIFDEDGKSISVRAYSIVRFKEDQLPEAYGFCNGMNDKFRWVKFFVDSENDLTASLDAVISPDSVAEECYELLMRTVSIVDSACEVLYS